MSKHPLQLTNSLSVVYGAMLAAKRYPSKASDAGTEKRNAKCPTKEMKIPRKVEIPNSKLLFWRTTG